MPANQNRQVRLPMRHEKSAGAIIFHLKDSQPYYLLLKYPNYWGFVKGLMEKNESEEQTMKREMAEEAGVYNYQLIEGFKETQKWFYRFEGEMIRKEAIFYLVQAETWNIKISHEHEDFKWCSLDEALSLMKIKSNRQLLEKAHNFLKSRMQF
jgi:8-oxo-dGTP pyrophosphatase MutT (NUDIX family)